MSASLQSHARKRGEMNGMEQKAQTQSRNGMNKDGKASKPPVTTKSGDFLFFFSDPTICLEEREKGKF